MIARPDPPPFPSLPNHTSSRIDPTGQSVGRVSFQILMSLARAERYQKVMSLRVFPSAEPFKSEQSRMLKVMFRPGP